MPLRKQNKQSTVYQQICVTALAGINRIIFIQTLFEMCDLFGSISLVESIPEGMVYPNNSTPYPSTFETWLNLIDVANHSIEIASFYWTLRKTDVYPDSSSLEVGYYYNLIASH